jgi:TPR repeat protein
MNRIKANDPAALCNVGSRRCLIEGDYDGAIKYWTKAAKLGDVTAHYQLGHSYHEGKGVEKDREKAVYHWEKAAIGGHPSAIHNLGCHESRNGSMERAVKHHVIAANLGHEGSMKTLWAHYSKGNITKEDLDATLRTHQAALDEMKSPEREEAEKARS